MDMFYSREYAREVTRLRKEVENQKQILKESKNAMIDMLNAFQAAGEFFYKTGYCDNCDKNADIDCPYRESNGNCSLGYAKESDVDRLIEKINGVLK